MTWFVPLTGHDAAAVADLCRRGLDDPVNEGELTRVLFGPTAGATVFGDPAAGVAAVAPGGHLRLLVVDPGHRRKGLATELLRHADGLAGAATALQVSADPAGYFWPGVPADGTALCCFLEAHGFQRVGSTVNVDIDLAQLPSDRGGWAVIGPDDQPVVAAFTDGHHPQWHVEFALAAATSRLVVTRDEAGIRGACAFGLYRDRAIGPVAVRSDLIGRGAGRGVLLGALHQLRRTGLRSAEVQWVGPIRPYVAVGGRLGRSFLLYRKDRP